MPQGGYYTKESAVAVELMLALLAENPEDRTYHKLELVSGSVGAKKPEEVTVFIRLIDPNPEKHLVGLADTRKIIRCITRSGKHADIQFGREVDLPKEKAMVYLQS